jgi:hypothetical protein
MTEKANTSSASSSVPRDGGLTVPRDGSLTVLDLEDTFKNQDYSRYYRRGAGGGSDEYLGWDLDERTKDKQAEREENAKEKDYSRARRRDLLWAFLITGCLIACAGVAVFFKSDSPEDRKTGMAAAITAFSAISGLAAGLGFR